MKRFIFDPATTPLTIPLDFLKLFHSSDNPVGLASFLRGVVGVASLPPCRAFLFYQTSGAAPCSTFSDTPTPRAKRQFHIKFFSKLTCREAGVKNIAQ